MSARYTHFHGQMVSVIDSINHDADPSTRLSHLQRLSADLRRVLLDSRDEAAYELRTRYSSEDAEAIAGVSRRYIDYWAKRWQRKNGLPRLKQMRRQDLSGAMNLTGEPLPTSHPLSD